MYAVFTRECNIAKRPVVLSFSLASVFAERGRSVSRSDRPPVRLFMRGTGAFVDKQAHTQYSDKTRISLTISRVLQ